MNKYFLKCSAYAASLLLALSLTACVTESDEAPATSEGDGSLIININSTPVGDETRATTISSISGTAEKKIKNMLVTIFDATGESVVAQFERDFTANSATALDISEEKTVVEPIKKTVTAALAVGQKARVACNVSANVLTQLKAATTFTAWNAVANSIDQALIGEDTYANDGTKAINPEVLPMYGEANVAAGTGTRSFKIDVTVKHTVAKVTLKSVKLNVTGSQQLQITRVFMINVAENFNWNPTTPFYATNTKFYQGNALDDATDTGSNPVNEKQYRDYLTTASLDQVLTQADPNFGSQYFFYAMPNQSDAAYDTRLVSKASGMTAAPAQTPPRATTR